MFSIPVEVADIRHLHRLVGIPRDDIYGVAFVLELWDECGAYEAGGKSIGLNIVLPHEQAPNPYITPELCFQFHYFASRKMHFLMRAVALVSFPGGLGTLDELFEVLTLTQTRKIRRRPIVLIGRDFWQRLIDFDVLVEHGVIGPEDKNLFYYAETAEEAWDTIKAAYSGDNPALTARQFKAN